MPRRESSTVPTTRLGGLPCVPLADQEPLDIEPATRIDWARIAAELELPSGGARYLESKAAGHRGAAFRRASRLTAEVAEKISRILRERIHERGPLADRYSYVIRGGHSARRLSYRDGPTWTLAQLTPEFDWIMTREKTKNITVSTCSEHSRRNWEFLEGTGRGRMEQKNLVIETRSDAEPGSFEGLLSPYGSVDATGDRILHGAYVSTIAKNRGIVPLLWAHDMSAPIGRLELKDTPGGLRVRGQIVLAVQKGREAYELLKAQAVRGLSIGFKAVKSKMAGAVRELHEIDLFEGSLVVCPAAQEALVDSVKHTSDTEARQVISLLNDWADQLRSEIRRLPR